MSDAWCAAMPASVEDARQAVVGVLPATVSEGVTVDRAIGRISAASVTASSPWPALDRARVDGVAVRAADTAGACEARPLVLVVAGESGPGEPAGRLSAGMGWRVRTGAAMPVGADAVVPVEDLRDEGERALLARRVVAGSGVEPAGNDVPAGAPLLEPGELLTPRRAALVAAMGIVSVQVSRRPRVAILVTGSEYDPAAGVAPSNGVMLAGLVDEAGGAVSRLGSCPDDERIIARALLESLPCDLVLTSGGTGRSAADRMTAALGLAGAEPLFRGLAVRPGHTTLAAHLGGCPVVALPGTPAAAAVVFELLVRPVLRRLQGRTSEPETWELPLTAGIPAGRPGRRMVWGRLCRTGASVAVEPLLGPAVGPTLAAALGDVLLDLPDGGHPTPPGSPVAVLVANPYPVIR